MATLVIKEGEKPYIEDIWSIDDFRNVADAFTEKPDYEEEEFTDDELIEAMEKVADRFDANLGITWETIEAALDSIVWERRRKNDHGK